MSENAFAGDLLQGLAANPELLKNAMQMASALASSGVLNGLLGDKPKAEEPPKSTSGSFADLLSGLTGQGKAGASPSANERRPAADGKPDAPPASVAAKGRPTPCHRDRVDLLRSICPFLPDDKREKVYFLIKLLELMNSAEQMGLGKLF